MNEQDRKELRCDVLLLFATSTEQETLKEAAKELGLTFQKRTVVGPQGDKIKFYSIGTVGSSKVNAVKTEMGPFSHGGSASRAIYYRIATGATAIIQLGMAFGVDPKSQGIGDVLVSTSIIPYDLRVVRPASTKGVEMPLGILEADVTLEPEGALVADSGLEPQVHLDAVRAEDGAEALGDDHNPSTSPVGEIPPEEEYVVDYSPAIRHRAKEALLQMFKDEHARGGCGHKVFVGGMLSGGARIFSRRFLAELVKGVPQADDGIVGGEMEGVGLISVSPPEDPLWIVAKGISDFADEKRDGVIKDSRPVACRNAARFVLSALMHMNPGAQQA